MSPKDLSVDGTFDYITHQFPDTPAPRKPGFEAGKKQGAKANKKVGNANIEPGQKHADISNKFYSKGNAKKRNEKEIILIAPKARAKEELPDLRVSSTLLGRFLKPLGQLLGSPGAVLVVFGTFLGDLKIKLQRPLALQPDFVAVWVFLAALR